MKYKIFIDEVPKEFTIWQWIIKTTDIKEKMSSVILPLNYNKVFVLNHNIDIKKLHTNTIALIKKFGNRGWKNQQGEDPVYRGLSLTCNPDYEDESDDNSQTLGTYRNKKNEYFYNQTHNFIGLKNTYYDTYGFRELSPCGKSNFLNYFLKGFQRTLIRSRIAILDPTNEDLQSFDDWGWHRDETVFENIRINIPIETDETYFFQIFGQPKLHLQFGNIYSWDTNIPHRVFPSAISNKQRIHLVLGFSPWFDYDSNNRCWVSNDYYGNVHPFEMLFNGSINREISGKTII